MALSKNKDRYSLDESFDLDPLRVQNIFNSANSGSTKKQCRLGNELTEKDPAVSQAWSVRVAAIASCPWEVVGGTEEENRFIEQSLRGVQPSFDSGMVSFGKLLQFLQSAVMHGFATSTIDWKAGGASINGFKLFSQSLFSFQDSDLPFFQSSNGQEAVKIKAPRWIYHTATNSREAEPLRSGLVRPLAYLYAFRRHVQIEYLRGLEKYGLPTPFVGVDASMYDDDNTAKQALNDMMSSFTYDGYGVFDKQTMEIMFPTADSGFNADNFKSFLEFSEKQIFRLILGQDSTSSADNSNRSTAAVHNLVRADMLASDANAVEATVNNQIIKPLFEAAFGASNSKPFFRFRLKGVAEIQEMATVVKTLNEAGWDVQPGTLSERLGFPVTRMNETEVFDNGNS
jgi:phage gp29-like protein